MSVILESPLQLIRSVFAIHSRRELKELYLFLLLFSLAAAMITVFEPIFLYQQGFSLSRIALYYGLHYTLYVILLPFGGSFIARFGSERSLAVSTPLLIVYFLLLAGLPYVPSFFWLALVMLTLHKIFFWPAYNTNFAQHSDRNNRGTEQSVARALLVSAGVAGPLLGGLVAATLGFSVLFLVAAATLVIAVVPLLRTEERYNPVRLPYGATWQYICRREHRKVMLGTLGWAADLIVLVFWPLYMFSVIKSVGTLGIVVAVGVAAGTAWSFVIGELSDRFTPRRILRFAVPFVSLNHLLRPTVHALSQVLPVSMLSSTGSVSIEVPYMSYVCARAKRREVLTSMLAFETVLAVAKALTAFALVWLFATVAVPTAFTATFIVGALATLLFLLL